MMYLVILCAGLSLQRLGPRRIFRTSRRQLTEALAGLHEDRRLAAGRLVATHDDVDVERVKLDAPAEAASRLGGDEGREPRNGSITISPRLVRSRSASSIITVGLTVGWSWRPRRASEPSEEAPG